jgi:putative ABC transport system permease protein
MFVVLGLLLLLLAAIGIDAVVAYSVAQHQRNRSSPGAWWTPRRVRVGETMRAVLTGWATTPVVDIHIARGVIFLSIFLGVPAILMLVAALACWLPAHRANQIDATVALKQE